VLSSAVELGQLAARLSVALLVPPELVPLSVGQPEPLVALLWVTKKTDVGMTNEKQQECLHEHILF
jgi:hypothetical protein